MNGRTHLLAGCFLTILVGGCDDAPQSDTPQQAPQSLAEAFDAAMAGAVTGCVVWEGEVPRVPPFLAPDRANGEAAFGPRHERPNPNAPVITEKNRVAGAVVYLRNVDPRRSRSWDWQSASVEMRDFDYRVRQGDVESRTGFVRRGAAVTFVSRQSVHHLLRARGDAFFTLAFPDADTPRERVFDRPGVVELSSGAGYFWARAYLFVAEHPYYARTDGAGRFTLPQVPAGAYELVCWLPNWHEQEHERDSDSWQIARLTFRAPVEITQTVRVDAGKPTTTTIIVPAATFAR